MHSRVGKGLNYLKRLLQYLHGRVFGFCCRISPWSSGGLGPPASSMDCIGIMMTKILHAEGDYWRCPSEDEQC